MCTAATYKTTDFYFGRNLDFERSWGESVTITPRKYQIALRSGEVIRDHFAMIGMAISAVVAGVLGYIFTGKDDQLA